MNVFTGSGNLVDSPDVNQYDSGKKRARMRIAMNNPYKEDDADYIDVVVWGPGAKYADTLAKGDMIEVKGRIESGNYENNNGETVYYTRVNADRIQAVIRRNSSRKKNNGGAESSQPADDFEPENYEPGDYDDVPF